MKIFISALLMSTDRISTSYQADMIRGLVNIWLKHLMDKKEDLELDWSNITITNSTSMDFVFKDAIEAYPALAISLKLKHLNCSSVVASELRRIFEFATLYNTDVTYKQASEHIYKELATIGPKGEMS